MDPMYRLSGLAIAMILVLPAPALAHGDEHGAKKAKPDYTKAGETAFGIAVDPGKAKRTIAVEMSDTMRFNPPHLTVKRGESVRFVAKNAGKLMHEMVLGTRKDLEEHAALMRKHPEMEHDEPNMLHVAPGKSGQMGWRFTRPGEFYYGCLIPGHLEAGMIGKVVVK